MCVYVRLLLERDYLKRYMLKCLEDGVSCLQLTSKLFNNKKGYLFGERNRKGRRGTEEEGREWTKGRPRGGAEK